MSITRKQLVALLTTVMLCLCLPSWATSLTLQPPSGTISSIRLLSWFFLDRVLGGSCSLCPTWLNLPASFFLVTCRDHSVL